MSNASGNSNICDERKAELKEAFKSAKTVQEMLKALEEMETYFKESELGEECFIVAEKLFRENDRNLEQVISFGKRALTILTTHNNDNNAAETIFLISRVSCLLGSAYRKIKCYDESLGYLTFAETKLSLLIENCCTLVASLNIQIALLNLKNDMIRTDEAVVHAIKVLEIKEQILEEGCVELAEANKYVAETCFTAYDHKRALPYCLKAKEIYAKCLGPDSQEVAQVTRYLALLYAQSGDSKKAFEHNQSARSVMREQAPDSAELLKAEIDASNMMADLGRHQEAVDILKGVLGRNDIAGTERLRLSVNMARALCHLKKYADARTYLETAQGMLEQEEMHPLLRVVGFADMSDMYEMMKDFETAISLIKRSLAVPELPQNFLPTLSDKLFSLLFASGKEKEGFVYMEGVLKRLKESFGPKHSLVGTAYWRMGVAHANSGQDELAVKYMKNAKDIMDASLGPHHLTSLQTSHDLSLSYASLGRFRQALQIEKMVVKGLKGLPPSELGFMHDVNKHLIKMREKVAESPTNASCEDIKTWRF